LGLLWTSAQPFLQGEYRANHAPSWSWASVIGQIDWFNHAFTEVDSMLGVGPWTVNVTYRQAPFGAVQSGFLVIHGLLQEAVMDELPAPASTAHECLNLDLADVHLDFWDEVLASRVKDAKLFCFRVCCFNENTSIGPSGLILGTKDEQIFFRVGVFCSSHRRDMKWKNWGISRHCLNYQSVGSWCKDPLFSILFHRNLL
jgi:hypothetical protein